MGLSHAEMLRRWTAESGPEVAQQKLEEKRGKQREASRRFYEKYSQRVVAWVRRYQAERNPEGFKNSQIAYQVRTWSQQEKAAGRPRPLFCEICGGQDPRGKKLAYDHCHKNGHFRGWLCGSCNSALGFVRDDPERLMRMAMYLELNRK